MDHLRFTNRFGRLSLALVLSVAVAALVALTCYAFAFMLYPVAGVQVEGTRMFPESEVWDALPDHASLPILDAEDLEREVEANPWVEGAEVLKNWDSGIVTVQVEERRAVVGGTLGGREVYFGADGVELPGSGGERLARIDLDEGRLREVLRIIEALQESGSGFEAVTSVDASGVKATVDGRDVLFAGRVGAGQLQALRGLMREHPEAGYFDLRSPERVVVGE